MTTFGSGTFGSGTFGDPGAAVVFDPNVGQGQHGRPAITITIGARSLTASYDDLSFSNVDPGGYEQLTATASDTSGVKAGDEVTVRCGLDTIWHGRLNEAGDRSSDRRSTNQLAALGYGAKLTDKRLQVIYADRDLTQWKPTSTQRRLALAAVTITPHDATVAPDDNGAPAIAAEFSETWVATARPYVEAVYNQQLPIGSVYYEWSKGSNVLNADANWTWGVLVGTDDTFASSDTSGELRAAGPGSGTLAATTTRKAALLYFGYNAAGGDGRLYGLYWRKVVVYGDHGLTKRGSAPQGFYPGDLVAHALSDSGAGFELVADNSSGLIVGHAVYHDPTAHQTVIEDMAKLMGWHYGTWEPRTVLDTTPRQFFTAPPAAVTCIVARSDIADLDAPKVRVDKLYDTAKVKWTDPAGTSGIATVTITNALAQAAGVSGRVLDLDMGLGDATTATTFGGFALALALASARGGGSGTLPANVRLPGGGTKPACLLKSGRDRIRILDLPDAGSLTASDADRQDSFLVRRVETTVKNGVPVTRVEFDGGADLLEVLQARLALAASAG